MINVTQHANRKLYVPSASRYTNLTELKDLVKEGEMFQVVDHTGTDVTAHIMSQVLVKCKNLPIEKLAELIRKGE